MSRHCPSCGARISRSAAVCQNCGTPEHPALVDAVILSSDLVTGDTTVKVNDPLGATSQAHGDQGQFEVHVQGSGGVGAPAEGRIAVLVRDTMRSEGLRVEILDGDDDRGDDRRLNVDGTTYGFQVTVAPSAQEFWRDARVSSASTQVPLKHAIEWLRGPIVEKAFGVPRSQLEQTILAVDVTHAGAVANPQFVSHYLQTYPAPSHEFGLASVWVVGPSPVLCRRLGSGSH